MSEKQWVVCAACRHEATIIAGARHFDSVMVSQLERMGAFDQPRVHWEQGFIDQHGTFLTRAEAFTLASKNGQLIPGARGQQTLYNGVELFSEDLY